jgi:hypothetical protein
MPIIIRSVLAASVAASLLPAAAAVAGGNPKPPPATPPVKLEIASPAYSAKKPLGVMYESGTAFEITAAITGPTLGIATDRVSGYIGNWDTGWIVFADPDGCLEIALGIGVPLGFQRSCLASLYPWILPDQTDLSAITPDETYLQFTIDRDEAGVADGFARNPVVRAALADPLQSGAPEFLALTRDFTQGLNVDPPVPESMPLGPFTGGGADDGFGYGADDDLPGLVVLSPRGVGLVYADADGSPGTKTSDFEPVSPRRQWNLAGFLNSVNYELKSNGGTTVIHAGMTLPNGLIAPLIALDNCIGVHDGFGNCDAGEHRFRVDGGPVQAVAGGRSAQNLWTDLVSSQVYEVRAFLVSGFAPAQLEDLNGDGKVTAADAKRAGYTVISNESVTRFRQVTGFVCTEGNLASIFGLDLDGNGQTSIGIFCPPGPGALKGIP